MFCTHTTRRCTDSIPDEVVIFGQSMGSVLTQPHDKFG